MNWKKRVFFVFASTNNYGAASQQTKIDLKINVPVSFEVDTTSSVGVSTTFGGQSQRPAINHLLQVPHFFDIY
jgi:hypothetical protein